MIGIDLPPDVHERVTILKARLRTRALYQAIDTAVSKLLAEMDAAKRQEQVQEEAGR
jgi:ribosome-associated translation inhibitor RaiA